GQNVILTNDQIDFVSSELTMILGADVFHSGRGDNRPIGETQFQHVKTYEVKALKEVFASVYRNSGPTLTFIILQKRHHTRFMPTEPRDGDKLGNCSLIF
ncbi:8094_t:CDS:2, partial [Rhizophagus irregularis]